MVIQLRPLTEPEYHCFFQKYVSDPIMEPFPFVYNREAVERSYVYNYQVRKQYAHYGIFEGEEPVGCLQLKRMDEKNKSCEFGIILRDDSCKNRGIGTQAIRMGMNLARTCYGMKTILGDTASRNKRMIRVFEKLGFTLIETVPGAFRLTDGRPDDRLVYRKDLNECIGKGELVP